MAHYYSDPVIKNSIIWGNDDSYGDDDIDAYNNSVVTVNYTDFGSYYEDASSSVSGTGFISVDPQFADAGNDDFHLKSSSGRWNGTGWTNDSTTSVCINGGDPSSSYSNEPIPNGSRINMGAYAETAEASKSSKYHLVVYLDTDDHEAPSSDMQWQLDGLDTTWRNSAEAVLAYAGNYTIKCRCNSGTYYIAPEDLGITVGESHPISYSRTYSACGYLAVYPKYIVDTDCYNDYAQWKVNDGEGWRSAGEKKVATGSYTVSFPYIGGNHRKPDPIDGISVTKGSEQTINRSYEYLQRYVDGTDGDDTNLGTIHCPLATIQEALEQIPDGGYVFVCRPAYFYEWIDFPDDKDVTMYGQYGTTITVYGYHSPSQPPANITVYDIEFTQP